MPQSPFTSHFTPKPTGLTQRQTECLHLASEGMSSRQIGRRLQVSARTVDDHILAACRTLGVRTRVQAVALMAHEARVEEERRSFLP